MAAANLLAFARTVHTSKIDPHAAEIERLRSDEGFTDRTRELHERGREILDRLAK